MPDTCEQSLLPAFNIIKGESGLRRIRLNSKPKQHTNAADHAKVERIIRGSLADHERIMRGSRAARGLKVHLRASFYSPPSGLLGNEPSDGPVLDYRRSGYTDGLDLCRFIVLSAEPVTGSSIETTHLA